MTLTETEEAARQAYAVLCQDAAAEWRRTTPFHPLTVHLGCWVPLYIAEWQRKGGPIEQDFRDLPDMLKRLCTRGDVLLFGGGKPGQATALADDVAQAIAVLSFLPGGIRIFGQHWESQP